jgi:hypothetical protein
MSGGSVVRGVIAGHDSVTVRRAPVRGAPVRRGGVRAGAAAAQADADEEIEEEADEREQGYQVEELAHQGSRAGGESAGLDPRASY